MSLREKPGNIEFEITTACNYSCRHCYCNAGKRSRVELSTEEIFSVVDQLVEAKADVLDIVGGEPMLRRDLLDVFAYAKAKGLAVIMNTNASLASRDYVQRIREVLPELKVGVSLDGPSPEVHEMVRGRGTFEKTYNGLLNFLNAGFDTTILFVVNKLNCQYLSDMVQLAKSLGANLYVDRFVPVGRGALNKDALMPTKDAIAEVSRSLKTYLTELDESPASTFKLFVEENLLGEPCTAGRTHASILVDGNVVPCGHFRYNSRFYMGNVRFERFRDIWNRFDQSVLVPERCASCQLRESGICHSGCFGNAHLETSRIDTLLCQLTSD